ncbi:MAG: DUF1294 domain-containing protein [Sedimentisphaeraceae bacterium JB056]
MLDKRTNTAVFIIMLIAAGCGLFLKNYIGVFWSVFTAINIAAFLLYGYDKMRARRQKTRVPEAVLLAWAAIGGSIGSILGQQIFRHKTKKKSFRLKFWAVVILQLIILLLWFWLKTKKA